MKKSNLYTTEILDYYSKGLSANKIAELLPLCSISILKVLKENGIEATTEQEAEVVRMMKLNKATFNQANLSLAVLERFPSFLVAETIQESAISLFMMQKPMKKWRVIQIDTSTI